MSIILKRYIQKIYVLNFSVCLYLNVYVKAFQALDLTFYQNNASN